MTTTKYALWCCAMLLALSGQTPAPSPAPLPSKPLRHLEYAFSVDYQSTGNAQTGAIGTNGSGIVQTGGSGGRRGTLTADVMGIGSDGGMIVRTSELLEARPRASQQFLCVVYGDMRVVCPPNLDVTDAENVLMQFLGRGFYDPALLDANGRWQRKKDNKTVAYVSDLTAKDPGDGKPLQIYVHTEVTSDNGAFANWHEEARLTYDPRLEVPIAIRDVAIQAARGNRETQTMMDFQLTKDSFAKP
jgi:hypothetical protein